jgi:hypothetical protein
MQLTLYAMTKTSTDTVTMSTEFTYTLMTIQQLDSKLGAKYCNIETDLSLLNFTHVLQTTAQHS